MSTVDIIKTTDLTKTFKDLTAVDNISFTVNKGEIFGFLGPNGAGKTTTIKMLTTLLHPSKGSAEIASHDIIKKRDDVRKSIGVVFQEPALDTELTGQENLDFHARMYGIGRKKRDERIKNVLQLVDLTDKKDVLVKNYSGGMKRRLEIARGLMHSPKVLFLDEPTLGLDAQTRQAIWKYIKKMNREEKTTIFLTTHYMDEADNLCNRVGIIDHGKILVMDTIRNLKKSIGNDVITLNSTNNEKLLTELKQKEWVEKTETYDHHVTLGVKQGDEKIPIIIELARKQDLKIKSISVRQPTLDDVFISYTGRTIRDEETKNANIPPGFKRG
ncbi:MAG: ATP-binding cassette domain-containing protein [Candidatus Thermoplasmatota archaeon]|nr:ATP-binding cassette domain-containing protein [Candidatus Thermoplasmatota archaeon]